MKATISMREISDPSKLFPAPLVSVYMLTYLHERYIAEAIEGVLKQKTDFPIEIVIGEDCSPDRTLDVAQAYQRKHPDLIRIISGETNVGATANAIRCQAALRGKYVAFCEGDDYWTSGQKLARQVAILEANRNVTLVCHAADQVDAATGVHKKIARPARRSRRLTTDEIVRGDGSFIPTCSILTRKVLFEDKPSWWLGAPVGDYPLALRAAQLGQVSYIDEAMSAYRCNVPGSWTTRYQQQNDLERRYAHALAIRAMLRAFDMETGHEFERDVNFIIRRYVYDAIARSSGSRRERRHFARISSSSLNYYDRRLLDLAILCNLRLTRLRELPEAMVMKFRALVREIFSPQIEAEP